MKESKKFKEIYEKLKPIQCDSWDDCYHTIVNLFDDVKLIVVEYEWEGYPNPFYYDNKLGYMVHTKIIIDGIEREKRIALPNNGHIQIDISNILDSLDICFFENAMLFGV